MHGDQCMTSADVDSDDGDDDGWCVMDDSLWAMCDDGDETCNGVMAWDDDDNAFEDVGVFCC